jgi:hypothetical protein
MRKTLAWFLVIVLAGCSFRWGTSGLSPTFSPGSASSSPPARKATGPSATAQIVVGALLLSLLILGVWSSTRENDQSEG